MKKIISLMYEARNHKCFFTKKFRELPQNEKDYFNNNLAEWYYKDVEIDDFIIQKAKQYNLQNPKDSFAWSLWCVDYYHGIEAGIDEQIEDLLSVIGEI